MIVNMLFVVITALCGCDKGNATDAMPVDPTEPVALEVKPTDINVEGFEFLEKMQGHWVGSMDIMSDHYDWFAFDYRAIGPAHVLSLIHI